MVYKKRKIARPREWTVEYLGKLSDEDFIEVFATAVADRTDLVVDKLKIINHIKQGAPPESIGILLQEAQRRKIPLKTIAEKVVSKAKSGKSFISNFLAPPSWRRYEIYTAYIILEMLSNKGVRIDSYEFDARIKGKISGAERQVDLLIKRKFPLRIVAYEFRKLSKRAIRINEIEAFAIKLRDISATKGVMITTKGFQRGAISTAKNYCIDLFKLKEFSGDKTDKYSPNIESSKKLNKTYWILEDINGHITKIIVSNLTEKSRK